MGLLLRGAHLPGNTGGGLQAGGGGRREVKGRRDGWRDGGMKAAMNTGPPRPKD